MVQKKLVGELPLPCSVIGTLPIYTATLASASPASKAFM